MLRTSFFSRTKKVTILPVLPSLTSKRMSSRKLVFQSAMKSRSSAPSSYTSPGLEKIRARRVAAGMRRLPREMMPSINVASAGGGGGGAAGVAGPPARGGGGGAPPAGPPRGGGGGGGGGGG